MRLAYTAERPLKFVARHRRYFILAGKCRRITLAGNAAIAVLAPFNRHAAEMFKVPGPDCREGTCGGTLVRLIRRPVRARHGRRYVGLRRPCSQPSNKWVKDESKGANAGRSHFSSHADTRDRDPGGIGEEPALVPSAGRHHFTTRTRHRHPRTTLTASKRRNRPRPPRLPARLRPRRPPRRHRRRA